MSKLEATVIKVKDIVSTYNLDPDWQRNCDLWSSRTVETYLDDVILGRPMPPILALRSDVVGKIVIDGKQRIFNLINALASDALTPEERTAIENYEYFVNHYDEKFFIKEDTKELDTELIVDFFYKTNSLGTRLNAQEIRRALHFNRPYIKFVKKEKQSRRYKKFINKFKVSEHDLAHIGLRFLDEEFILKMLAFYLTDNFARSPYTNKVIDALVSDRTQKDLDEAFEKVLEVFNALYEDNDVLEQVRFVSKYKGLMPIVIGLIGQYERDDIAKNRHQIGEFVNFFWFHRHDEIADRFNLNFNSGSGFYRAIVNLIIDKLDDL